MLETGIAALNAAKNGVVFNGATAWTFPNVAVGNEWTVSVWIKLTGSASSSAQMVTQLWNGGNVNLGYQSQQQITSGFYTSGHWFLNNVVTDTPYLNDWTYFQSTWDGVYLKLYINNLLASSTNFAGYVAYDSGLAYRIGRRWDITQCIQGDIGEVRIYNNALNAAQLSYDYSNTRSTYGV